MFSIHAFFENFDGGNADNYLNAVVDQTVFTEGTAFRVPPGRKALLAEYLATLATTLNYVRVETPSIRTQSNQYLAIASLALTDNADSLVNFHPDNPRDLQEAEQMQMLVNSDAAAAVDHYGVVWLGDGPVQPVKGKIFTTRLTAAIAQASGVWTVGNLAMTEQLPVSDYQIVGMHVEAASGIVARLVLPDSQYRPGVGVNSTPNRSLVNNFRFGRMGVMGSFNVNQPPRLEVLGGAAVTQRVYLDLIRTG